MSRLDRAFRHSDGVSLKRFALGLTKVLSTKYSLRKQVYVIVSIILTVRFFKTIIERSELPFPTRSDLAVDNSTPLNVCDVLHCPRGPI